MDLGMLWFDNSNTELKVKVRKAADYYRKKFGRFPNICFVHPSTLDRATVTDEKISVQPLRAILPGHLWIGINEGSPP